VLIDASLNNFINDTHADRFERKRQLAAHMK